MKTVILCCNYNEGKSGKLLRCLRSLEKNKQKNTIIGIVDNKSCDNSLDIIRSQNAYINYVLTLEKNFGKALSINLLYKYMLKQFNISSNDLLIIIDSDVELYDTYIQDAEKCFKRDKNCIFFTSKESCTINSYTPSADQIIELDDFKSNARKLNQYKYISATTNIGTRVLTLKNSAFVCADMFPINLGNNNSYSLYGLETLYLISRIIKYFPNGKIYINDKNYHIHTNGTDENFIKWKRDYFKLLIEKNINKKEVHLPEVGFFD